MTRYAVGDLQGCLQPLQCLLEKVDFDPHKDQLWLVGDLINRGPASLQTLRFIKQLGDCTRIVLGNHDLHFLAVHHEATQPGKADTFNELLAAPDRQQLAQWLQQQPLLYSDPSGDYHMVHAGIPPIWTLQQAIGYAREVEATLNSNNVKNFFQQMYGNQPDCWSEQHSGLIRLRIITNYLTRMRFCSPTGELDFNHKLTHIDLPGFKPWFAHPNHLNNDQQLIVGHWAAIEGKTTVKNIHALDTGCVWGKKMTLFNLETRQRHECNCDS